jgi:2-polyprenyl-6-hydroxyphenyl methylase / 3-demethylubiquinone-9 3-methyltransferase
MSDNTFHYFKFSENRSEKLAHLIYEQRISDSLDIFKKHKNNFYDRNCPFCDSSLYDPIEKFRGSYGVAKCKQCSSVFVNPVPNQKALEDYYNNSKCNGMLQDLYRDRYHKKNYIIDDRVKEAAKYILDISKTNKREINILEVGCGSGAFLSKLHKYFYVNNNFDEIKINFNGIDIDRHAISKPVSEYVNLECFSIEEYSYKALKKYDLILHFELIEHLSDPALLMQKTHALLKDKGILLFTTQNYNGLEMMASNYNSYRILAHSIFPPMHLNAFSTTNILHFSLRNGFNILHILTPGKLDVDMVNITSDFIDDKVFKEIANLDEKNKGFLQNIISKLMCSSHMQCVLTKHD